MNNLLVILPHNPGDIIMGLHVVSRLREAYPRAEIDFVVGEECRELVEHHPFLTKTFTIPTKALKNLRSRELYKDMLDMVETFITRLAGRRYDLSVNLFQDNFGALIHGLLKAGEKVGYTFETGSHYRVRNRFMEHLFATPVARKQNPWHVVDIFLRSLQLDSCERPGVVFPPLPPIGRLASVPEKGGCVLQIGSAWPGKRWPLRHWARLTELIVPHLYPCLFIGAPEERPMYHDLINLLSPEVRSRYSDRLINLMGITTLLESLNVIKQSSRLVTGDTVAMHMGAAVGTETLALFGASNPVETGPYGSGHFAVQYSQDIGESLALKEPNVNLENIIPEWIADFILSGKIPKKLFIWESEWDEKGKMQLLVNQRREPHPFQMNSGLLEKALTKKPLDFQAGATSNTIKRVFQQLDKCLLSPSRGNFLELEDFDRDLAKETRLSVTWEAYRVAINGLPLDNLRSYLHKRKSRLFQTLGEESVLAGTNGFIPSS